MLDEVHGRIRGGEEELEEPGVVWLAIVKRERERLGPDSARADGHLRALRQGRDGGGRIGQVHGADGISGRIHPEEVRPKVDVGAVLERDGVDGVIVVRQRHFAILEQVLLHGRPRLAVESVQPHGHPLVQRHLRVPTMEVEMKVRGGVDRLYVVEGLSCLDHDGLWAVVAYESVVPFDG